MNLLWVRPTLAGHLRPAGSADYTNGTWARPSIKSKLTCRARSRILPGLPRRLPRIPCLRSLLKILALDTSSEHCSAALLLDGDVRQRLELAGQRHSQLLLPMVRSLLAEAGLALGALDGIAVAVGPGSFTGLRIAVSAAQGLAFGAELPVAGVSTLEALAWSFDAPVSVACIDARMGEIYFAACRRDQGRLVTVVGPVVGPPAALPDLPHGTVVGGGNAFARYAEGLDARWPGALTRIDAAAVTEARHVGALAMARHPGGFTDVPGTLLPVYVRDKVALRIDER